MIRKFRERVGTRIAGTKAAEDGVRKALTGMLDAAATEVAPQLIAACTAAVSRKKAYQADDALIDLALETFRIVLDRLRGVARRMVERALQVESVRHERRFLQAANAAIGIDLSSVIRRQGVAGDINTAMLRSAALITGLSDDTQKRIALRMLDLVGEGASTARITKALMDEFGFAKKRAAFIARDQVATFNGEMNRIRQTAAGITEYQWSHVGDERVRGNPDGKYPGAKPSHWHREGQRFRWDKPPSDGHPGVPINCLPGYMPVSVQSSVKRLFRRWHNGEATEIITKSGPSLDCTANHPVLTNRGWIPAHLVNVGDYLVETAFSRGDFAKLDVEQRQPRIEDFFQFFAPFNSEDAELSGRDFHGEATANEEVKIVSTKGFLGFDQMPDLEQGAAQRILKRASMRFCELAGRGDLLPVVVRPDFPADSLVRIAGELQSFLLAQLLHSDPVRLRAASEMAAAALQESRDGVPLKAELFRQRLDTLPANISGDKSVLVEGLRVVCWAINAAGVKPKASAEALGQAIGAKPDYLSNAFQGLSIFDCAHHEVKRVVTGAWSGHVFNLETASNWYLSRNIVVHNCRCVARPVFKAE